MFYNNEFVFLGKPLDYLSKIVSTIYTTFCLVDRHNTFFVVVGWEQTLIEGKHRDALSCMSRTYT